MAGYPETDAEGEGEVEPDDGEIESVQGRILAGAGTTTGPRKTGPTRLTAVDPGNSAGNGAQAVKLLPHPQPPVALGLLKVKPEPCMEET
jgi:hypothetical protein